MEPRRARTFARAAVLVPFFTITSVFVVLSVLQIADQTFTHPPKNPDQAPSR